jgi:predicted lipoprotein with Yx(FWY)xxD motif
MKKLSVSLIGISMTAIMALVLSACAPMSAIPASGNVGSRSAPVETRVIPQPTQVQPLIPATGSNATGTQISILHDPTLGDILIGANGMVVYIYTPDGADTSTCAGGCLKAWPAVKTSGTPQAGTGVDQTMLGTTKASDGSTMVTYNHHPLYYWVKDTKPGMTSGQGVGSVWYVVSAKGDAITGPAAPAPSTNKAPAY